MLFQPDYYVIWIITSLHSDIVAAIISFPSASNKLIQRFSTMPNRQIKDIAHRASMVI